MAAFSSCPLPPALRLPASSARSRWFRRRRCARARTGHTCSKSGGCWRAAATPTSCACTPPSTTATRSTSSPSSAPAGSSSAASWRVRGGGFPGGRASSTRHASCWLSSTWGRGTSPIVTSSQRTCCWTGAATANSRTSASPRKYGSSRASARTRSAARPNTWLRRCFPRRGATTARWTGGPWACSSTRCSRGAPPSWRARPCRCTATSSRRPSRRCRRTARTGTRRAGL
mmetsp:Transcript_2622/g.7733  ORF Transcript_2622/g.7733 Transcript_2622/m.7733 type:complete len:230 (-) Transcript_2622:443-1132(-)